MGHTRIKGFIVGNPDFRLSSELMRRAIAENVIAVTPRAIAKFQNERNDMFTRLMENVQAQYQTRIERSPWLGQQSSWQLPTTRRYHQSRSPVTVPAVQPSTAAWMVELARFAVPYGNVGIIKSFEQYVRQGETIATSSANWGNPFPITTDIRWFFRLSAIHLVATPWINVSGLSAIPDYLPGIPYDDFANTDDLWFPAGSSSSANVHFPVPGGQVLRIVCLVGSSQTATQVAAKVAGTIQSETNKDAAFVVRTTW